MSEGDREVEAQLIPRIYGDLHRIAAKYMRGERPDHTLQPTALVHEAYQRLVKPRIPWKCRAQFFATASKVMRHFLVDYARARQAGKRDGLQDRITLSDDLVPAADKTLDILVLDDLLERLATFDARQERIVELHVFAGLTFGEIGDVLNVSERTVKRDWQMARAWLKGEMSGNP